MGFNNKKKILAQMLTICIFSSLMSANTCFAVSDNEVTSNDDNTSTTEISIINNDNSVTNQNDEVKSVEETSIIKKFDFEYELQNMIVTYKNIQEAQKAQAKVDTINFLEQLVKSNDYTIDEKRELGKSALSNAVLNDIIPIQEIFNLKQDFDFKLNRQADIENLNVTIQNILNSKVSIQSKEDFCSNALELAMLSETISQNEYLDKLAKVQQTLEDQQKAEEEQSAKEQADKLAIEEQARIEEERLAQEEAQKKEIQEKAQAITTDTSVDISNLQTVPPTTDTQEQSDTTEVIVENIPDTFENEPVVTAPVTEQPTTQLAFNGSLSYTEKDFIALCNVVQHEVGNCSTLSKKMVASVVINRALSGIFPSSIYDVVNQRNQFTGMASYIDRTDYATEDTKYWCQYVLDNGIDFSNGAIYYYAPQWCGYMSYFENMTLVAEHDGQRYFK